MPNPKEPFDEEQLRLLSQCGSGRRWGLTKVSGRGFTGTSFSELWLRRAGSFH